MNNMFSGNREKKIPKTFKDCYKTDNVTNNLWLWAERLETIGIVLAVIVGIAAFIIGIVMFEDSDGGSLLISFLGAPVAAFLEYISFHIIALLIGSLASIVQNTRISADIALFTNKDNNIKSSTKNESIKEIVNKALAVKPTSEKSETLLDTVQKFSAQSEINIVLKKSLTDREQLVFEYFLNNIGKTVFAKDLAELLELPRDYVYKYIKNLRAKIEGDKLKNVPSGGFILTE